MGHPSRWFLASSLTLLAGCASDGYVRARALDLVDPFVVVIGVGPELSLDAQVTDLAHVAVGGGMHVEAGYVGRRGGNASVLTFGLPASLFFEEGILHARLLLDDPSGAWRNEDVQDECYIVHVGGWKPTNPEPGWFHAFDLELGLFLGAGGRLGLRPGELLDFVVGWFGVDLAGDDGASDAATVEGG